MQQTIDNASEVVADAKSRFERYSERLLHLFSFVPDDKLTWTPSPTAKSSLGIVAHCASVSEFFAKVITRTMPENMASPEEFFKWLADSEAKITTREGAVASVKAATTNLCKAIDTVNAGNIDTAPNSPFGSVPMQFWIHQGGDQLAGHVGQIEYLQTIWGDLDNHMG